MGIFVLSVKNPRTRGHVLHRPSQKEADLPTLVPPHNRHVVLLLPIRTHDKRCSMVHRHELLRAFNHVHVFRGERHAVVQASQVGEHPHHVTATRSDGGGHLDQRLHWCKYVA